MGKDKLKGGLSDKMTKKDIANKFKVSLQKVDKELKMGIGVEMEHVNSKSLAKEIAMDHLVEIPDYYTRLKKMEKEASKKWDVKESTRNNIKRLVREEIEFQVVDETPDVITYKIFYNGKDCGVIGLAPVSDMGNTMELVYVVIKPEFDILSVKILNEVIGELWMEFKGVHTYLLTPKVESRSFWHKMGANRLNDDYLMLQRGH